MRILINGWFFHRPHTGSGQYLSNLLSNLCSIMPESSVHVISPIAINVPKNCNLHVYNCQYSQAHKLYFEQIIVPRTAKQLKVDILHTPYWAPPLRSPCPTVVTIHDVIPLILPEHKRSLGTRVHTALTLSATYGTNQIITDSDHSRRDIIEHIRLPHIRIHTIFLGIEDRYSCNQKLSDSQAVRKKYNLPNSYVLYLGGFQRHKNLRHLLAAWTWAQPIASTECQLVVAGLLPKNPDGYLYDDLPSIASNLEISDTVKFIGAVDEIDKPALYQTASCFIFPSSYEGFGLPPLEAMASGVPVITTNLSALKETVGNAAYLITDPTDAREMGAAIISVIVDEKLSDDLKKKGLLHAAKFKWELTALKTLDVYKQAATNQ